MNLFYRQLDSYNGDLYTWGSIGNFFLTNILVLRSECNSQEKFTLTKFNDGTSSLTRGEPGAMSLFLTSIN